MAMSGRGHGWGGQRGRSWAIVRRTWCLVSPGFSQSRAISRSGGHATIIPPAWDGAGGPGAWCGGERRACVSPQGARCIDRPQNLVLSCSTETEYVCYLLTIPS